MTNLNLKLYPKQVLLAMLLASCNHKDCSRPSKCQMAVILDKTNSVGYNRSLVWLDQELTQKFEKTYSNKKDSIQCSRLIITGQSNVFPMYNYFNPGYPSGDPGSRQFQEKLLTWKAKKKEWMNEEVKLIDSLINCPCNSNTTDIFSILNGIQQVQKNNGPWDSTNVYIFSDMTNTARPLNMLKELNLKNAFEKGKSICQYLIKQGQIDTRNTENLYLTIYTPDKIEKPVEVYQFWKGFFEQWGLTHYTFEQSHS